MAGTGGAGGGGGLAEQRNQDATCYVGGVDDEADEELLWELFLQVGPIVSVFMPRDKVSGRHQNYAFVEFRGEEDADYAVKVLNMTRLYGKLLRVSKASADKARALEGVGANLFIGNLAPEVDEKALYDVFSAFGSIPSQPKVMRDLATGAPKGFGFVSFDSFEASDTAIACMHGQFLAGRQIVVQYAFRKDSRTERHGSAAERLLAAAAKSRASATAASVARPNMLFAAAPGQVVSALPAPGAGGRMIGVSAPAPPPMLPPAAIAGIGAGLAPTGSAAAAASMMPLPPPAPRSQGAAASYGGGAASSSGQVVPPPLPPIVVLGGPSSGGPPPLPHGGYGGGYAMPPPLPPHGGFPGGGAYGMPPPFPPHGHGGFPGMPPPPPPPMPMQMPPYMGGPPPLPPPPPQGW